MNLYLPVAEKQLSVAGLVQFWATVLLTHEPKLSSRHPLHWVVFTSAAVEIKSRKKALTLWKQGSMCSSRHNTTVRAKGINIFIIEISNGLSFLYLVMFPIGKKETFSLCFLGVVFSNFFSCCIKLMQTHKLKCNEAFSHFSSSIVFIYGILLTSCRSRTSLQAF